MNYLGHLYLSGNSDEIKLGNFIGDFVKGNKYHRYSHGIQQGIFLHRKIDSYTDAHPKFQNSKVPFQPVYGLFSGIVVDMVFDHFLAKNWEDYSAEKLREFAKKTHLLLLTNFFILPGVVRQFLPFLIHNRRLESYATIEGFTRVLEIMSKYTTLPDYSRLAMKVLHENYESLQTNFHIFMRDILEVVQLEFKIDIMFPKTGNRLNLY